MLGIQHHTSFSAVAEETASLAVSCCWFLFADRPCGQLTSEVMFLV